MSENNTDFLNKFIIQQNKRCNGHATALQELEKGKKESHFIWWILPQLADLGNSSNAKTYGIADLSQAVLYLKNETLRTNYLAIITEINNQLKKNTLQAILGADDIKLISSLTLFREASKNLYSVIYDLCDKILQNLKTECKVTLDKLHPKAKKQQIEPQNQYDKKSLHHKIEDLIETPSLQEKNTPNLFIKIILFLLNILTLGFYQYFQNKNHDTNKISQRLK